MRRKTTCEEHDRQSGKSKLTPQNNNQFALYALYFQQCHQINRLFPKEITKSHRTALMGSYQLAGPKYQVASAIARELSSLSLISEYTLCKFSCKGIFEDYLNDKSLKI